LIALFWTRDLLSVLRAASWHDLFWPFLFGLLWGVGGLTFGLTMRYLGLSLGMAIVLGLCAAFGTLIPPLFTGEFASKVLGTTSGRIILMGVAVCLAGIAVAGMAGVAKERATSLAERRAVIAEFNLRKGIAVATLSGVMSACFAYGLAAGDPIRTLTLAKGTPALWQGLPVLVVVLVGGFVTNFVWSVFLNIRNSSGHEYLASRSGKFAVPLLNNYLFCALAGCTWYMQFFFYTMGETQMGIYKFSSWTLHMASIIIFSSLWGLGLKEWKGAGPVALRLLFVSLALLVLSTVIVGYGNYLGAGTT
jgi:L-rhamnose-H+ transport protein